MAGRLLPCFLCQLVIGELLDPRRELGEKAIRRNGKALGLRLYQKKALLLESHLLIARQRHGKVRTLERTVADDAKLARAIDAASTLGRFQFAAQFELAVRGHFLTLRPRRRLRSRKGRASRRRPGRGAFGGRLHAARPRKSGKV